MIEDIKSWFESVSLIQTDLSDWGVESVELYREELDINLLPIDYVSDLTEEIYHVDYYYYSCSSKYFVVYCLKLNDYYLLGLLDGDQLEAYTLIKQIKENE